MTATHYFFKFGTKNSTLTKCFNNGVKDIFPLSIWFGEWKADEKEAGMKAGMSGLKPQAQRMAQRQVDTFYSIVKKSGEVYLWIWYKDEVMRFKPLTGTVVYDGPSYLISRHKSKEGKPPEPDEPPKSIDAELIKPSLKKIDLPEVFSNINSNQGYNRATITELKGVEKELADSIIRGSKIEISRENFLKFLSPVEFETLIFQIFTNESSLCSSFRGGTLKDYDLRVSLTKEFHGLPSRDYWIQVKKKDMTLVEPLAENRILVHTGSDTNVDNRTLGKEWVTKVINERPDIVRWLKEMTFKYNFIFDLSW